MTASKKKAEVEPVADGDALFSSEGIERSKAVEKPSGKKKMTLSPTTPEGDNAGNIIAAWIDWYTECDGVPIPKATISRMSKHVLELIQSGYNSADIKYGLAIWTIRKIEDPMLSPQQVDSFTWDWASSTRGGRRNGWRERTIEQVRSFGGNAGNAGKTTRQQRQESNLGKIAAWANEE